MSHPMFLEFLAPGVDKGRAVRYLARRLGVELRATLAIGDQLNDLEMLAEVGIGVAMAGAPEAVRAVARLVAPPVEEEGAAQVLEELVLWRSPGRGAARLAPSWERPVARTVAGGIGENGPGGPAGPAER